MAKGILIASMNMANAAEDEFHDWYDTEHMPERVALPRLSCAASAGSAPPTARSRSRPMTSKLSMC